MNILHRPGLFLIRLDRGVYAYLKYRLNRKIMYIESTYTPGQFRGKGLAAKLMEEAISYAKNQGLEIVPLCSYAKHYLNKLSKK
ncbi:MAG: GNAT family N-acetyltransferase [Candidatus Bathyarchaeia archaeon]